MIYDKKCDDCGCTFEVSCKYSEKESKVSSCPECGSTNGTYIISAPVFLDKRLMTTRHPKEVGGFNKVLQKIDKTYGTSCSKV